MINYYDDYINYSLRRCLTWEELVDKRVRRKHNSAMDKINLLHKKMFSEPDHCADIVLQLLEHEDERVRMGAGCYCIMAQVHVESGKQALIKIQNCSPSKYMRFLAGSNLDHCTPFSMDDN